MPRTFTALAEKAPGLGALRDLVDGDVVTRADAEWDKARLAWNLAADQRPVAVVYAESVADVATVVGFARENGLRVTTQGTGHFAISLGSLEDTILLKTTRMRGLEVDAEACVARVEAGVLWEEVTLAAAEHGLAALSGTAGDVGVVGYTLGGGLGWLARRYGLAANSVVAVELVTADGRQIRAHRETKPDLFWAVRGGGGSFGVVTAIEFALYPVPEVYAGTLFFPFERAAEILQAWRAWVDGTPDELTSVGRLLQFPPLPQIPEHVRGKSFVVVEAAFIGSEEDGARLVQPLRELGPAMDTFATISVEELRFLHMDPPEPVPALGDGMTLTDLTSEAIDALVAVAGPGSGSPLLSLELRQLGGAVAVDSSEHGAVGALDAGFALFAAGITANEEMKGAVEAHVAALKAALAPWAARRDYFNFADRQDDAESLFPADTYRGLQWVKAAYDPEELFRGSHPIRPATRT
jgi:FAD binding domain/Berberine and berberine like